MFAKPRLALFFLLLLTLLVSACVSTPATTTSSPNALPTSVTIAYQPSLGATSLVVLRHQQTLEKQFPNTKIQWKVLNSGAAVREAVIANQVQVGYLGVPPFLVGWDRGLNWKILAATSQADVWLVARDARLKTLKDFTPNDKIGVVAPDSLQAINLRKAAQTELGDAHALDKNLVSIAPADAEQALLSGQIAANFASSPFQFREIAQGGHIVVHSYDTFGKVTSDEIVAPQSFYDQYPTFAKKLYADLVEATAFITSNRHQTADYLSNDQVGKASSQQFETWLADPSFEFDTHPVGLSSYATFMKSLGLISKTPTSDKDLLLPTVQ